MDTIKLREWIFQLEVELMKLDKSKLNVLLAEDFVEFGSSGHIYLKCDQIHNSELIIKEPQYEISDFEIKELSSKIILATYQTRRVEDQQRALRSSIWRKSEQGYQMIFHQGTAVSDN